MQEYTSTDQQLHILGQVIAKANRTFVSPKEDDSHTNLSFDSLGRRIIGQWIEAPSGAIMLTLNLKSQNFEWIDKTQSVITSFKSIGKHISEIENEISKGLPALGLKSENFKNKLHYDIPEYSFIGNPVQKLSKAALEEWGNYRLLAYTACSAILNYLSVEGEIRIWPHHFDTGIYVLASNKMGIGFGLAMEDKLIGLPYLYMSGYPSQGELHFNSIEELHFGKWITSESWNGAILTLEESNDFPNAIPIFIVEALNWYLKQ